MLRFLCSTKPERVSTPQPRWQYLSFMTMRVMILTVIHGANTAIMSRADYHGGSDCDVDGHETVAATTEVIIAVTVMTMTVMTVVVMAVTVMKVMVTFSIY
ncbi:unnamed protein product [Toxocara canis]|uniref:Secreted protein n=1 Tax=Toxocara canis TaxID=6265 RepID=A0A183UQ85_TOXCA|nr:unnamed protein product [Toxocara canis]